MYRNGFRSSQQRTSPHTTKEWRSLPERLLVASERLKNAQIENLPAVEVIKRHEMIDGEHVNLLRILALHPGKVLLSGYDNDLYNDMLPGWNKVQKKTQAEAGLPRVETLWMNYEMGQMELPVL